jgi:hypothetical protein
MPENPGTVPQTLITSFQNLSTLLFTNHPTIPYLSRILTLMQHNPEEKVSQHKAELR